ncbi:MAG TPA: hypothetical protein VFW71_06180 [Actinomycetota bacterium]|nr:hypothetical protein [Actinomycetota bacterium]
MYQDQGLKNWGKGLPAGMYSWLVQVTLYEPCFLDPGKSMPIGVTAGTEFTVGLLPTR